MPTLEAFAPRFVDGHARVNRHKPSGIAGIESILKWHLVPTLGQKRLDAITNERVAGIEQGVHILRHTFCSHLAMKGAPARAIQELGGDADLSTTQRYMPLSRAATEDAIRLLDGRHSGLEPANQCGDILDTGEAGR